MFLQCLLHEGVRSLKKKKKHLYNKFDRLAELNRLSGVNWVHAQILSRSHEKVPHKIASYAFHRHRNVITSLALVHSSVALEFYSERNGVIFVSTEPVVILSMWEAFLVAGKPTHVQTDKIDSGKWEFELHKWLRFYKSFPRMLFKTQSSPNGLKMELHFKNKNPRCCLSNGAFILSASAVKFMRPLY